MSIFSRKHGLSFESHRAQISLEKSRSVEVSRLPFSDGPVYTTGGAGTHSLVGKKILVCKEKYYLKSHFVFRIYWKIIFPLYTCNKKSRVFTNKTQSSDLVQLHTPTLAFYE